MSLLTLVAVLWIVGMASLLVDLWVPRGLTDIGYRTLGLIALAPLVAAVHTYRAGDYLSFTVFVLFVLAVGLVAHARVMAYRRARQARERLRQAADADRRVVRGGPVVYPFMRVTVPSPSVPEIDPAEVARVEAAARAELEAGKGAMGRMFGA